MAVPGEEATKELSTFSHSITSDEDLNVYCQPCDEDGPRLPAHGYCTDCKEHLCRSCFTSHKKHKLSKHHTLLDAKCMPQLSQQRSTSNQNNQPSDLTTPCRKHPTEIIKFYCHDHKELLCSVCVTINHTANTCNVSYIPDISGGFAKSKENETTVKVMNIITERYEKIREDLKKMRSKSNISFENLSEDIKQFRKDVNQWLDKLEKQIEDEAMEMLQKNETYLEKMEMLCDDSTKSLLSASDTIKELNETNQADKLFVELKLADDRIEDCKRNIHHLQSYVAREYCFQPNETILNVIENNKSIGTLELKPIQKEARSSYHHGKIYLKVSEDKNLCQIFGMILLNPNVLILTDKGNKSVKLIDTSSQMVIDHLSLDSRPGDITKVTSAEFAVTFPNGHAVGFFTMKSNRIIRKYTIGVDGECHAISCYIDKLVVLFYNPPKLQILDLLGNVQTTVKGENILSPQNVTSNSRSIFVSDWGLKSVTILNWQGEVISTYDSMGLPSGLAVSGDGTFFVCDSERNAIEEIAEDGSSGKVLLKGVKTPSIVCWCADTKKLYYSSFTLSDKEDNFLKICNLS